MSTTRSTNKTFSNSITLVRVSDGTNGTDGSSSYVHIQYSASPDGQNMSSTPNDYMGVYTGPLSEAPTDPNAYHWSRVKGQDGQNGQDGQSAPATLAQYSEDGENNWTSDLKPQAHKYVRFSYDNGDTWTEPIRFVGEDSSPYVIQTNYEEISRFLSLDGNNQEILEFSPEIIEFKVFDYSDSSPTQVTLRDKQWSLSMMLQGSSEWIGLGDTINGEYLYPPSEGIVAEEYSILYFNFLIFLKSQKLTALEMELEKDLRKNWEQGINLPLFKFTYLDGSRIKPMKIIITKNSISSDGMKMLMSAGALTANIANTSLRFNANGMQITNGDFTINSENYIPLEIDSEDEFNSLKITKKIYRLNDNYTYVEVGSEETFDKVATYAQQEIEPVLFMGLDGNLALKGNVYADNGYFKGTIEANSGSFSGRIMADSGIIGDFSISGSEYEKIEQHTDFVGEKYILLNQPTETYAQIVQEGENYYIQVEYKDGKYYKSSQDSERINETTYYIYNGTNYQKEEFNENNKFDPKKSYYVEWKDLIEGYYMFDGNTYVEAETQQSGNIYYAKINLSVIDTYYQNLGGRLRSIKTGINGKSSLILDGHNGKIIAENIELGSGAKVVDKIVFSKNGESIQAALYNPDLHKDNLFIESSNLKINNKGLLQLGSIEMFGGSDTQQAYIRNTYIDNNNEKNLGNWIIKEDGTASFTNIVVDKATIKNTVFETETVQTVGSLMLFKEGFKGLTETGKKTVLFETKTNFETGDWGWDGNEYYQVTDIIFYPYYFLDDKNQYTRVSETDLFENEKQYYVPIFQKDENGFYKKAEEGYYALIQEDEEWKGDRYRLPDGEEIKHPEQEDEESQYFTPVNEKCFYRPICFHKPASETQIINLSRLGKSGTREYVEKTEDEPIIGRHYYIKENEEYKKVEITSFDQNETYYYIGKTIPTDFLISVLGENRKDLTSINDFAIPNSLTLSGFAFDEESGRAIYEKQLILGQLSESGIDSLKGIEGFGLYANNVYLNGSLTTKNKQGLYAGINTLSDVSFTKQKGPIADNSPIILWGGANGKDDIDEAPFQVTSKGTLYAQNAIIENSIITGGDMYATNFFGANIRGYDIKTGQKTALKIYDTSDGIIFQKEQGDTTTFKINQNGFERGNDKFINLLSNKVQFCGEFKGTGSERFFTTRDVSLDTNKKYYIWDNDQKWYIQTSDTSFQEDVTYYEKETQSLMLTYDYLAFLSQEAGQEKEKEVGVLWGKRDYNNNNALGLHLYIYGNNPDSPSGVSVYKEKIIMRQKTQLNAELSFGENMEYKKSKDDKGYDLYVYLE